ncbi:purine nucleoside phosphorylase YfiH [Candidatus Regiella insecticola]|uniref:Purine nucleoside phosphorylase n=1 Tax=Candidatus Regiella insecticola TaxID=138073 RepID=A0A6L2ZMU1_9ENTR|nr:purine nucleoside phosphorylase YfiH [Candidatus Regiella insecticola]GFN46076.1 polyphenol oxidase [Candidatus Regiella insecticola]
MDENGLIIPDWPAPANVKAFSTTRHGGISLSPYDSLNLGFHVGDVAANVVTNRQRLMKQANLPNMPIWLDQVHGIKVLNVGKECGLDRRADAAYSQIPEQVCAVMTADCLPVLFCSFDGSEVAAAHAGWRGLCAGVLESTLTQFRAKPSTILAWLGPAIGSQQFIVGAEVKQVFTRIDAQSSLAFTPHDNDPQYSANIYLLAKLRLQKAGIEAIYGGGRCTVTESSQFFSYRREGITGRMASLIYIC